MAITTYAELQTAVNSWAVRSDSTAQVKEHIALGENELNRRLGVVETDATLTGVVNSRVIDIAALDITDAFALFLVPSAGQEREIQKLTAGDFAVNDLSGEPSVWSVDVTGDELQFERELDAAYSFRFRYRGQFALSDSATSNWLLRKHPDVYLAASLVWGHGFHEDMNNFGKWKGQLEESIGQIQRQLSRLRKGTLRVDAALQPARHFDYRTGQ
jgi:hypothetical protein